jgi:hypothetical protein
VQHSADEINKFQALGLGEIAFIKLLDCVAVLELAGVEIAPTEYAVALLDADGSPNCLRGSVGDVLIAAQERGLHVVPVH